MYRGWASASSARTRRTPAAGWAGAATTRGADKFATLRWRATEGGAVFVEGASAWLECSVYREVTVGDHDIVLLLVHELDSDPAVAPLVFHGSRFRPARALRELPR